MRRCRSLLEGGDVIPFGKLQVDYLSSRLGEASLVTFGGSARYPRPPLPAFSLHSLHVRAACSADTNLP